MLRRELARVVLALWSVACAPGAAAQAVAPGDVFASVGGGQVLQYSPDGKLKRTLRSGRGGELTGSAFDSTGDLYVTAGFAEGGVVRFDASLAYQGGGFGGPYENLPESMVFDSARNFLVGAAQNGGDRALIQKFDSGGKLLESYPVEREDRGSDWIDLAPDQKTVFYTSEGSRIKRYHTATRTQLPDFYRGGATLYALRILRDGGVLAANSRNVLRLDSSGKLVRTYLDGARTLFALNLDPDGASFWTADKETGDILRIDIDSGKQLAKITTGNNRIGGLGIYGEITASAPAQPPGPSGHVSFGTPVPCAVGTLAGKSVGSSALDLSNASIAGTVDLELRSGVHIPGAVLEIDAGQGFRALGDSPVRIQAGQGGPRSWPVRLRVGRCPGQATGTEAIDVRAFSRGGEVERYSVPVRVRIVPDTWLECWWPWIAAALGGLFAAFVICGFWSPARFAPRMGVMLSPAEDIDAGGFFYPLRAQRGSGSGFYRDAAVYIRQDFRISGKSSGAIARLRADHGRNQVKIKPAGGAALWRLGADGEWQQLAPDESRALPGTVFRNDSGTLFFELRSR